MKRNFLGVSVLLVVAGVASALDGAASLQLPAELGGPGHLSAAELRGGGRSLVAWEATEEGRSEIVVYRGAGRERSLRLDGLLAKGARWIGDEDRFVVDGVIPVPGEVHGEPETRVYRLTPGGTFELEWRVADLEKKYDSFQIARQGDLWLGASFGADRAHVAVGSIGQEEPTWTWDLAADDVAVAAPTASEYSAVTVVGSTPGRETIAILWGGRLWLAQVGASRLVSIPPPAGCAVLQQVSATARGFWVQCHDGGSIPVHRWALYPPPTNLGGLVPALIARFASPRFLASGVVLDLDRRQAKVEVFEVAAAGPELVSLGVAELPSRPGARLVVAGDAILEEVGPSRFRVIPLSPLIERLRRQNGS